MVYDGLSMGMTGRYFWLSAGQNHDPDAREHWPRAGGAITAGHRRGAHPRFGKRDVLLRRGRKRIMSAGPAKNGAAHRPDLILQHLWSRSRGLRRMAPLPANRPMAADLAVHERRQQW
jgi:hypothetical protein